MYIIDRFEGDRAVVETEDKGMFNLPRCLLPAGSKEGDVINILISVDKEATLKRSQKAKALLNNFFDE